MRKLCSLETVWSLNKYLRASHYPCSVLSHPFIHLLSGSVVWRFTRGLSQFQNTLRNVTAALHYVDKHVKACWQFRVGILSLKH